MAGTIRLDRGSADAHARRDNPGLPAGLLLRHRLRQAGIDAAIVERRACAHVEGGIDAGVHERVTTDLMAQLGLADRKDH